MKNYYNINSQESYDDFYNDSVNKPDDFWENIAENNFQWKKKWSKVVEYDFEQAKFEWFKNAKLNITENCIDRHLENSGEKTAILFVPNDDNSKAERITYHDLQKRVNMIANVLKSQGVRRGDRVCIYLPMIPELAITVLACARIGAIHSVVFAGFSSKALATRIVDCNCKIVVTSDGAKRGTKTIDLKSIVDDALKETECVEKVLVKKYLNSDIIWNNDIDLDLDELLKDASDECDAEVMDAEDPLFILYTSGSTGNPKGMLHTTAGYMVYTAYTFKNIFDYQENDVYWCTADIGWITGHSYIVYGPLLNGATTVMYEGVPSHPDCGRFWSIVEDFKINQFYTAPTAIRALAKESIDLVNKYDLSSLKVIGSVGEPINEDAWNWYNENIGKQKAAVVDTWWQTETGGVMISPLPHSENPKPTYATFPLPGVQVGLFDENNNEIDADNTEGALCVKYPWPSMARTIWGNHQRYIDTYFSAFKGKYFSGDCAMRDKDGYRVIGRMDDIVIVSGHNLGTAPIEDTINEHQSVVESAIIGVPHDIKGNALYGFVILKEEVADEDMLQSEINQLISTNIGPIAKLDYIQFVPGLPKTRSGKIMRRILRKIAEGETEEFGDISTLLNPEVVEQITKKCSKLK